MSLLRVSGSVSGIVVAAREVAVSRQVKPTPSQSGRFLSRIPGRRITLEICVLGTFREKPTSFSPGSPLSSLFIFEAPKPSKSPLMEVMAESQVYLTLYVTLALGIGNSAVCSLQDPAPSSHASPHTLRSPTPTFLALLGGEGRCLPSSSLLRKDPISILAHLSGPADSTPAGLIRGQVGSTRPPDSDSPATSTWPHVCYSLHLHTQRALVLVLALSCWSGQGRQWWRAFLKGQGGGRSHPGDPSGSPGTPAQDHSERLLLIGELLVGCIYLALLPPQRLPGWSWHSSAIQELPARVWHNLSEIVNMEPLGFLICIFVVVILCSLFLVDLVAAATLTLLTPPWGPLSGLLLPPAPQIYHWRRFGVREQRRLTPDPPPGLRAQLSPCRHP